MATLAAVAPAVVVSGIHDSAADSTYASISSIADQTSQAIARAFLAGAPARQQTPIERLEYVEPQESVDVLAGEYSWRDLHGIPHVAAFYVRTCPVYNAAECRAKRADDYNEQLVDQFYALEQAGAREIAYKDAVPSAFF